MDIPLRIRITNSGFISPTFPQFRRSWKDGSPVIRRMMESAWRTIARTFEVPCMRKVYTSCRFGFERYKRDVVRYRVGDDFG